MLGRCEADGCCSKQSQSVSHASLIIKDFRTQPYPVYSRHKIVEPRRSVSNRAISHTIIFFTLKQEPRHSHKRAAHIRSMSRHGCDDDELASHRRQPRWNWRQSKQECTGCDDACACEASRGHFRDDLRPWLALNWISFRTCCWIWIVRYSNQICSRRLSKDNHMRRQILTKRCCNIKSAYRCHRSAGQSSW